MAGLNIALKFCARQPRCDSYGFKVLLSRRNQVPKVVTVCNYNTNYKRTNLSLEATSSNRYPNSGNYLSYRHCMAQAATDESCSSTSYFQLLMLARKKQAQRSILLEVSTEKDIPYAVASCEKFGAISKAFSYKGVGDNHFLLLEFAVESAAQQLLLNCKCKNIRDSFTVFSRLIRFEKKFADLPKGDVQVIEENPISTLKAKATISDLIEYIYSSEKISELNTRLRYFFCILLRESISGLFPYCDALPFGSSVNGIGRHGCDLDVMIRLYPEQVNDASEFCFVSKTCIGDVKSLQQKTINCVADILRTFFPGVSSVQKIMHARMPIFKLKHRILNMDCDVSVNNMSAILMSEMIHFCGEVDFRVRPLLYAVKKWAKEADITHSQPGTQITNFGLTVLVLFFLQNRPTPILPPFIDSLVILGEDATSEFRIQYLKSLEELKIAASLNEESLAFLLKEFLTFLATYPFQDSIISLMAGKAVSRNKGNECYMWVQYPFEEDLNITKNVSNFDCFTMIGKAKSSSKCLENSFNQKVSHVKEFGTVLGVSKKDSSNSSKIDVLKVFDSPKNSKNNGKPRKT